MPLNVQCKRCANLHNDWCKLVVDSPDPELVRDCQYYRTLTNYDRIISKTPEELAVFICSLTTDCLTKCPAHNLCVFGGGRANGLVRWLKQEAKQ